MFGHRHGFSLVSPVVALLLCAAWLSPSPALSQAAEPETPYVGTIDFDTVEARSGAGRVFYPVAELKKGDRVTVIDDDFFTWFRVAVPESVTATVRQADVEAKGDGSRGLVTADIATVNVLGVGRNAAESFKSLKTLSKGQSVAITGRDGDYFLIKPPKDALIFLPPGSVKPLQDQPEFDATEEPAPTPQTQVVEEATPEENTTTATAAAGATSIGTPGDMVPLDATPDTTAQAVDADGTTDTPTDNVATTTDTTEIAADTTVAVVPPEPVATTDATAATDDAAGQTPPAADTSVVAAVEPVPVETPAVNLALRELELAMLPHFAKPVERQPLDEIEAAYRKVAEQQDLVGVDQRIVESRLAAVQRNRQFAAALAQIQQRQAAVPKVQPVKVEPDANEPWAAIGVLSVSSVLGETTFRVVDPATRRTIAYLRPAAGLDPALNLGQIVGVKGARQYDTALNHQLIVAQQIKALDVGP